MEGKQRGGPLFDVIVVGGGATGCGIALDAATRGLKTLLLERGDFSSGTSSKSTKLLHGGVRYLEAAVKNLDRNQYRLIRESLKERFLLIKNAPHLCHRIELFTPVYRWPDAPYLLAGLSLYDFLSGTRSLGRSRFIPKKRVLSELAPIKKQNLKGCIRYYDGQFNDFRMNITIAKTAQLFGAELKNYSEVTGFIKENGKIAGVIYRDTITNEIREAAGRVVINATGPFADLVRKMDTPDADNIIQPSSGTHIAVDSIKLPSDKGILIPRTEDGRVIFILPWEGTSIIGTTDEPTDISFSPAAKTEEIEYLLRHVNKYFDLKLTKKEIKSAWCGIRPLLKGNNSTSTNSIVRDYRIEISNSNLVTIAGGKWTTFRKMAEKVMDTAVERFNLNAKGSVTERIIYYGSDGFNEKFKKEFMAKRTFDRDILQHLLSTYGTKAHRVIEIAQRLSLGDRLLKDKPVIAAEVVYTLRSEFVKKPVDFLERRVPLLQTDTGAARKALKRVNDIISDQLQFTTEKRDQYLKESLEYLNNMNGWRGEQ